LLSPSLQGRQAAFVRLRLLSTGQGQKPQAWLLPEVGGPAVQVPVRVTVQSHPGTDRH